MPYFITKENVTSEIVNVFSSANAPYDVVSKISDDLKNQTFNVTENLLDIEKIVPLVLEDKNIARLADLLFQVKDNKFYLAFILKMLLATKHYQEICLFFSRTFVNHIGSEFYVSKKFSYDFSERYFDRFMEATKFCEIEGFAFLPFLFAVVDSKNGSLLNKYSRPAKEFLEEFILKNEGSYLSFINTEEHYEIGHKIYCELFPKRGARRLIDNIILENYFNFDDAKNLFFCNIDVTMEELREYILKAAPTEKKKALELYLSFGDKVRLTLHGLYEKIDNAKLKAMIKEEIDFNKNVKFETIGEFIEYANLNANEFDGNGLSGKYLIYFRNGIKANDNVIGYILKTFKDLTDAHSIKRFEVLKKFFSQNELDNFGMSLIYNMGGVVNSENKWVAVFVSAVCSDSVIARFLEIVPTCISNNNLSSFVLTAICQTKANEVVNFVKQIYMEAEDKHFYYHFLELLAESSGVSPLDYLDEMTSNYGLDSNSTKTIICNGENLIFEISDNLGVRVKNCATGRLVSLTNPNFVDAQNAIKFYNDLTFAIMEQIGKFKKAFELKRTWQPKVFVANILSNPLLKKVASSLVFGAYKQGTFEKIVDLGEVQFLEDDFKIALVHPSELSEEQQKNLVGKPEPFKQINVRVFKPSNYDFSSTSSSVFCGICVLDTMFNARMKTFDYKMSSDGENYYYKAIPHANLLVKVDVEHSLHKNSSIIGNIEFYNLNLLRIEDGKYIIKNVQPEQIGTVNPRIYSLVMAQISDVLIR